MIKNFLKKNEGKGYYQPIEGVAGFDSPKHIEHFRYRNNTILDFCDKGSFLDIGCNIGFTSFALAKARNEVVGIDVDSRWINISEKLAEHYKLDVNFVLTKIEDYVFDREFDYSLFLVIFHHMWLADEKKAFETLNYVAKRTKKHVLMAIRHKEWIKDKGITNIPEYIIEHSDLSRYQELGDVKKMAKGISLYAYE